MAYLSEEKLAYSTVKCYLSAIRHMEISVRGVDPFVASLPRLDYVLRGLRRRRGSVPVRPRLPITPDILRALKKHWNPLAAQFDIVMLWAACLVGFFGFLRAGEFTVASMEAFDASVHLSVSDVSVDSRDSPSTVRIVLKQSKTDPFRRGAEVFLGRTDNDLCPVAALLCYLARRGAAPGPLFRLEDGTPLSRPLLVARLRQALLAIGLNCNLYAGHSLRIGAATAAAARGLEDSTIRTLGRWRSSAYHAYIRQDPTRLARLSHALAT